MVGKEIRGAEREAKGLRAFAQSRLSVGLGAQYLLHEVTDFWYLPLKYSNAFFQEHLTTVRLNERVNFWEP